MASSCRLPRAAHRAEDLAGLARTVGESGTVARSPPVPLPVEPAGQGHEAAPPRQVRRQLGTRTPSWSALAGGAGGRSGRAPPAPRGTRPGSPRASVASPRARARSPPTRWPRATTGRRPSTTSPSVWRRRRSGPPDRDPATSTRGSRGRRRRRRRTRRRRWRSCRRLPGPGFARFGTRRRSHSPILRSVSPIQSATASSAASTFSGNVSGFTPQPRGLAALLDIGRGCDPGENGRSGRHRLGPGAAAESIDQPAEAGRLRPGFGRRPHLSHLVEHGRVGGQRLVAPLDLPHGQVPGDAPRLVEPARLEVGTEVVERHDVARDRERGDGRGGGLLGHRRRRGHAPRQASQEEGPHGSALRSRPNHSRRSSPLARERRR